MGGPAAGELTRSVYYITITRRLSTSSITTRCRADGSVIHTNCWPSSFRSSRPEEQQ